MESWIESTFSFVQSLQRFSSDASHLARKLTKIMWEMLKSQVIIIETVKDSNKPHWLWPLLVSLAAKSRL